MAVATSALGGTEMKSPFPGVDPFIEAQGQWPDFHSRFITYLCDAIGDHLPEDYVARIGERTNLIDLHRDESQISRPDVGIYKSAGTRTSFGVESSVAVLEPITATLPAYDEIVQTFIEIHHLPSERLVTVIELLSPSNKAEPGLSQYRAKRVGILQSDVHLVELDLLTAGRRMTEDVELKGNHDYCAVISDSQTRPKIHIYLWTVCDVIPAISIPLRAPDAPIKTDLLQTYQTAYERGRYGRTLDYTTQLNLPISDEAKEWCFQLAKGAGKMP